MTDTKINDIVKNLLDGIHGVTKSETIVGEAQQAGEATVIPVHRLKIAFGAGSASAGAHGSRLGGDTGGQGVGGAVELDPVAAIAVGKDGHAHLLTVDADAGSVWSNLLADVPDILTRVAQSIGTRVTHELRTRGVSGELDGGAAEAPAAGELTGASEQDD